MDDQSILRAQMARFPAMAPRIERFFPLIAAICQKLQAGAPFCVAIDGRCGAGKTALANDLKSLFDCPVVRMDDFFLPEARKTPQRLWEPGGNADHERYAREVLPHLGKGYAFSYRRFDCFRQTLDPQPICIPAAPLVLAEGSYCLYPPGDRADLTVFVTAREDIRRARIQKRSPGVYERFVREWMPLEEAYFDAFDVSARCNFVFDTT